MSDARFNLDWQEMSLIAYLRSYMQSGSGWAKAPVQDLTSGYDVDNQIQLVAVGFHMHRVVGRIVHDRNINVYIAQTPPELAPYRISVYGGWRFLTETGWRDTNYLDPAVLSFKSSEDVKACFWTHDWSWRRDDENLVAVAAQKAYNPPIDGKFLSNCKIPYGREAP